MKVGDSRKESTSRSSVWQEIQIRDEAAGQARAPSSAPESLARHEIHRIGCATNGFLAPLLLSLATLCEAPLVYKPPVIVYTDRIHRGARCRGSTVSAGICPINIRILLTVTMHSAAHRRTPFPNSIRAKGELVEIDNARNVFQQFTIFYFIF